MDCVCYYVEWILDKVVIMFDDCIMIYVDLDIFFLCVVNGLIVEGIKL